MSERLSDLKHIFGPEGFIAQGLPAYEFRPQQLEMANAVSDAFRADDHLIVEAGTGVGKTFAYLLPAIDLALNTGETVVISTNTISLQEQLIRKDIPFLQEVLPVSFSAVLAKGRSNYLSRRRLNSLLTYERGLFDTREEAEELSRIVQWVETTDDGSRADLDKQPTPDIWDRVVSDRDNCLRSKCPTYNTCFYFKARRQMQEAHLLVVNHHLLFSDLAIRQSAEVQSAVLPDYSYLILDEAHHLEAVAGKHSTVELTNFRVRRFLDSLDNTSGKGGLSVRYAASHLKEPVENARNRANEFFRAIADWLETQGSRRWGGSVTQRVDCVNFVENVLDAPLAALQGELKDLRKTAQTDDDEEEITSHLRRCSELREDLDLMVSHEDRDSVYWIETVERGRFARTTLNATPVNVSEALNEYLFGKLNSVILTSATLATNQNFDFFKKRLGLFECRELIAGSPFDYKNQVEIHLPLKMPDPRQSVEFTRSIIFQVKRYLRMTHGKAFVLFTSYRMMDEVYEDVSDYLERLGIASFKQGGELTRTQMLESFKQDTNSVLFGTSSFWEGVDVQGESLSNVIITKLPFEVPTHPVVEAKIKRIEEQGGNSFMEFSLPEAILRLKQGFGRLIRTKTDKGMVVILDPRVTTKFYGKQFLNSLPPCTINRSNLQRRDL
ncbi:MAG: DEAD/DEAH box helicase [Candidatus Poribacteria bacterium]|nr:DEAD/DEAH box helicase [Candidatus Poribacteria bacterium]MDE0502731.1 DEAD/DEAH box helicase [Candidatus Poribacteria bacterium]